MRRSIYDSTLALARAHARWALGPALASVAAIVLISAAALVLSNAASACSDHNNAVHFPAESLTYDSLAKAVSKLSGFGGKALRYVDPGTATRSGTLSSEGERSIIPAPFRAASRSSEGPRMVDSVVVGAALISSTSSYAFDASVPEDTHKTGVEGYSTLGSETAFVDNADIVSRPGKTVNLPADCDVTVKETDDLDALVNSDPRTSPTKFCVTEGTHTVDRIVIPKDGDLITGPIGRQITRGPAIYGVPTAKIVGQGVERVISAHGSDVSIRWVDVSGGRGEFDSTANPNMCPCSSATDGCPVVGTGVGIGLGRADGTVRVSNVRVHHNDGVGISNAKGRITNSEFFSNTLDSRFLGVVGSGIKGITEFEAGYNYVHNEQGIGIWHDHSTSENGDDPEMSGNPGSGSWFHHNLVVDNGRYGIRYEFAPRNAQAGEHLPAPSFMAEDNVLAGNDNAGASHRDAQNGTWRRNVFGPTTVKGVSYGHNLNGTALVISDSGRSDRTDLWNAEVYGNALNGESLSGCDLPDKVVICSGNGAAKDQSFAQSAHDLAASIVAELANVVRAQGAHREH
jgi:hypothetical protein